MRVCDFHLRGNSDLFPGSPLEGFLESMLEESPRGAVARDGTLCCKRGPGRDRTRKSISGLGVGLLVSAIVLFSSTLAIAQEYRGTAAQRASCMPDAFRLCASYIPNGTMVEMCLRQQKPALSEACRSVFEPNDGSPTSGIRSDAWSTN